MASKRRNTTRKPATEAVVETKEVTVKENTTPVVKKEVAPMNKVKATKNPGLKLVPKKELMKAPDRVVRRNRRLFNK